MSSFASWLLGVLALRPCRMVPAEGPIKVDQTESNAIKPCQTCGAGKTRLKPEG
jgi:hypothetical protein